MAWNAWTRFCERDDSQGEYFKGIHRFLRSETKSISWITTHKWLDRTKVQRDGRSCKIKITRTIHLSKEEFKRYQGQWYLTLSMSGKNEPIGLRPDFRAVVYLNNGLHHESSEEVRTNFSIAKKEMAFLKRFMVRHIRLELVELLKKSSDFFVSWFRLRLMAIHCNWRLL